MHENNPIFTWRSWATIHMYTCADGHMYKWAHVQMGTLHMGTLHMGTLQMDTLQMDTLQMGTYMYTCTCAHMYKMIMIYAQINQFYCIAGRGILLRTRDILVSLNFAGCDPHIVFSAASCGYPHFVQNYISFLAILYQLWMICNF